MEIEAHYNKCDLYPHRNFLNIVFYIRRTSMDEWTVNKVSQNLKIMVAILTGALLIGCNSGEKNISSQDDGYDLVSFHQGSMGDGPIVGATIIIKDKYGVELASGVADSFANYGTFVGAMADSYPLTIEAVGGIDLVTNTAPTFFLRSVIPGPDYNVVNISPFSTLIAMTAEAMGGLTPENLEDATEAVLNELNFGFDRSLMMHPIFVEMTGARVASILKSSEQLSELIRRTQAVVSDDGSFISIDDVMSVIAADLADGVLDGKGTQGASSELALRAKVIAGQIILEALPNQLRINNVVVTAAMDMSIQTIMPEASPMPNTGQVASTAEMIVQLETAIKIGQRIAPSAALSGLMSSTSSLVGIMPETAAGLLPDDLQGSLDDSLKAIATLSTEEIAELNLPLAAAINHPPVITGSAPSSVAEGEVYLFEPESSDVDGDRLVFSITNKPLWAEFNTATGAFLGTPGFDHAGQFGEISISVTDGKEVVVLEPFSIAVENVNRLPSINGKSLIEVLAGIAYEFAPVGVDQDGDMLTFSIVNQPDWSDFNVKTGQLSGLPDNSHVGLYQGILIQVSDGEDIVSLPSFSITVGLNNSAPTISGVPGGVAVEVSAYSFKPSASDSDGNVLTFSIINRPAWALFSSHSGQLSGVPGYSDSGVYSNIQISVSDGYEAASLTPFEITVTNVNRVPMISGTANTVANEGVPYHFIPVATDADGDVLTFSVLNKPAWANFDSATGELSGTPGGIDAGSYIDIIISVFDGEQAVSLAGFNLDVNASQAPTTGSATLSWSAPTTRVDKSPILLSELKGYRIYYGTTAGNLTLLIDLEEPTTVQYVVEGLTEGTHYFAVSVYDVEDNESAWSTVRSKTI